MSKESTKKLYLSLLKAIFVAFLFSQRHMGIAVVFLLLALLFWIPYSFYTMFRRPDIRYTQLSSVSIWVVAFAVIVGDHYHLHKTTRQNANKIAMAITHFSDTHGHYPATLDEMGITHDHLVEKLGLSGYFLRDNGRPDFYYAVTFTVFDTYKYNFSEKTWVYDAD